MKKLITKDKANLLLFDSIHNHFSGTVQFAISLGAEINKEFNDSIPLLFASSLGDVETVRVLIKNGAEVNLWDAGGQTALMKAAWSGHTKTFELLIKNRAFVEVRCNKGMTALMYASMYGQIKTVELLIEKGADTTAEDFNGNTAFRHALKHGNIKIAKLLIQNEADFNREFIYAFNNFLAKAFMKAIPQTMKPMKPRILTLLRELCKNGRISKDRAIDIFRVFNEIQNNAIQFEKFKLKKPKGKPNSDKLLRIST